jgi:hypothetical protein
MSFAHLSEKKNEIYLIASAGRLIPIPEGGTFRPDCTEFYVTVAHEHPVCKIEIGREIHTTPGGKLNPPTEGKGLFCASFPGT